MPRTNLKQRTGITLAALSLVAGGLLLASPASADTSDAAEAASTANHVAGAPAVSQHVDADGTTAAVGSGIIEVSTDPSDGLTATGPQGVDITVGIPGRTTDEGVVAGGNIVYTDVAADTAVVARPATLGAQALIVIDGADAPTRYAFPVETDGAPSELRSTADGTIEVYRHGASAPSSTVAPAWAVDADGQPVPTHFEIQGSSLVQVVEHQSAAYPVVADPQYTWGIATGTTYYNRAETRSLKTRSYGYVVAAGLCAVFGSQTAGVACGVGAALVAQWNYVASNAYGDGKCVKVKLPIMWAYAYDGGYCK